MFRNAYSACGGEVASGECGNLLMPRKGDESPYYEPVLPLISVLTDYYRKSLFEDEHSACSGEITGGEGIEI